ncbi:hypothetical protein [Sphingomonas lenta]|uniref:Uncharacterized protein n=1 Tax=Sphingomonas lenta TaxID=1141887 RepID=A0A2A2SAR2_9SPHN|nr:hypothetical protein [Sphingomonas lenta]PAX06339.1 hypothetical protein CKY28_17830 [Sphingomonas lenta]
MLWFAVVGGASGVYRAALADDWSAGPATLLPGGGANGVAYDARRNRIVLLGAQISWRDKTTGAPTGPMAAVHLPKADHLLYDAEADRLFYSYGANGQSGGIAELDPEGVSNYGAPVLKSLTSLAGADAVEGSSARTALGTWRTTRSSTAATRPLTDCCGSPTDAAAFLTWWATSSL